MFEKQGGGTPHIPIEGIWLEQENPYGRWVGGWFFQEILPLRGSILQAENPRLNRVWQYQMVRFLVIHP